MNLYQEELMDHFRHPRNRGKIESPDFESGTHNPSCGDSVAITGNIKDNLIAQLNFEGKGCVISQAAASMLTQACLGKTLDEICKYDNDFIISLIGIPLGFTRLKCAILPLQALHQGISNYKKAK